MVGTWYMTLPCVASCVTSNQGAHLHFFYILPLTTHNSGHRKGSYPTEIQNAWRPATAGVLAKVATPPSHATYATITLSLFFTASTAVAHMLLAFSCLLVVSFRREVAPAPSSLGPM